MFYVYLLHSAKDNGFYIGYSTDLKRRLSEHTRGASVLSELTAARKRVYSGHERGYSLFPTDRKIHGSAWPNP